MNIDMSLIKTNDEYVECSLKKQKKAVNHLTKTRYYSIEELVAIYIEDASKRHEFLTAFCDIMQFDPNASAYTKDQALKKREYRKKIKEAKII